MHYHVVQRPGHDPVDMSCYLDQEVPCRFSAATPEELGIWLAEGKAKHPFGEWLRNHRTPPARPADKSGIVVHQSVSDAIRQSIENPKTTQTVPVTIEKTDGSKWVVGEAQVEVKDGDIHASMKLNPDSIAAHMSIPIPINSDLGPFSISTAGPSTDIFRAEGIIPREGSWGEVRFHNPPSRMCLDTECDYIETHQHGAACTRNCHCNRNGRSD